MKKKKWNKKEILREMGLLYFEIGVRKQQIEILDYLLEVTRK